MKKTIDKYDFVKEFGKDTSFTVNGLHALFDWLEKKNPDLELDVGEIERKFSQYDSAIDCLMERECDYDLSYQAQEDQEKVALSYLRKQTKVICFGDGIIIKDF